MPQTAYSELRLGRPVFGESEQQRRAKTAAPKRSVGGLMSQTAYSELRLGRPVFGESEQ